MNGNTESLELFFERNEWKIWCGIIKKMFEYFGQKAGEISRTKIYISWERGKERERKKIFCWSWKNVISVFFVLFTDKIQMKTSTNFPCKLHFSKRMENKSRLLTHPLSVLYTLTMLVRRYFKTSHRCGVLNFTTDERIDVLGNNKLTNWKEREKLIKSTLLISWCLSSVCFGSLRPSSSGGSE